jgi:hypothetical protein
VKRAFIALGLSTLLLATISPPTPTVETHWRAFSFRSDADGYCPAPIDRPILAAEERPTRADVAVPDEWTDLVLESGSLTVLHRDEKAWTSDPSWDVRQVVAADLDHDEQQEVALVLWKPFRREPDVVYQTFDFHSPWEEGSQRNHLFVYTWEEGGWQPLWCSSPIPDPILQIAAGDVDGDGADELVALEGSYGEDLGTPARHVSVWRWNGWGFTLQWRSPRGLYEALTVFDVTGDHVPEILVQDRTRV